MITRPPAAVTEKEIALATHAGMKAKLRPHQVRAVCWAIDVERNGLDLSTWWQNAHRDVLLPLPATSDRDSILFHPLTGQLFSLGDMKMPVLPKVYGGMVRMFGWVLFSPAHCCGFIAKALRRNGTGQNRGSFGPCACSCASFGKESAGAL